ncbi:MAG: aldo/keto reductase [Thermoleophilaceae bacterium]|nr:aldo/keto reductase [Thermoleophilaceae bacterium]
MVGAGAAAAPLSTRRLDREPSGLIARALHEAMEQNLAIVDRVRAVADRNDATRGQVALPWPLARYDLVVPIPGTRRVERLTENAGAATARGRPPDSGTPPCPSCARSPRRSRSPR